MILAVVLLSLSTSISLSDGQEVRAHACSPGQQCVPTGKCPDYLVKHKLLKSYNKTVDGPAYLRLLSQLKARVCNVPQRKVCCSQPTVDCGLNQLNSGFIVGGVSAKKGEFPFLALIGEKKEGREVCLPRKPCYVEYENRWNCGGNIINTRWVLTAAHCKPRNQTFIVRVGEHVLEGALAQDPDITDMEIDIQYFIVHQDYETKPPYLNDIALVRLPSPARPSQVVQVVCLPSEHLRPDSTEAGVVVGWGKTANNQSISTLTGIYAEKQQKLEIPILVADCPSRARIDPATQICAGGELGKDSCNGDSGGGLFWREGDLEDPDSSQPWHLIGIVSFGSRSCGVGRPAVYTRVSAFLDWIETNMRKYQ